MQLIGQHIAILVAEGVEDLEYFVPYMRLQEEGARVNTAALELNPIHGKNGLSITPDTRIDSLREADLSGLVIAGGWAPDKLRRHASVTDLVRQMNSAGKPLGITAFAWLAAKSRLASPPTGVAWKQIFGASWLCGIGFTMSLFIASLAFTEAPLLDIAKIGILSASVMAGVAGVMMLRRAT